MPASLSADEVRRIAQLARIDLTPDEVALFTRQLAGILDYVAAVQGLDTTGVLPTTQVMNRPVDWPDEPAATLPRDAALANAPEAAPEAGLFKVPRVMG